MKKSRLILATAALALTAVFSACGGKSNDNPTPAQTKTFTVTFNSNGGSAVASQTVSDGGTLQAPTEPTRTGYTFAGWFTDAALTKQVDFPLTITADITLYAKWLAVSDFTQISTAADLDAIRNNIVGDSIVGSYMLMADIDLSGYSNWVPIGAKDTPFTGTFEGNYHKITGLTITSVNTTDFYAYAGLFGWISGGSISNLGVETGSGGITDNIDLAGGIVGELRNGGTITGCYTTGNISAGYSAGGIAAELWNSTITNCYSTANVSSSNENAGGIAGNMGLYGGVGADATINNCYSSGNISAEYIVGGIAGGIYSAVTITGCAAINPAINGSSGGRIGSAISGSINTISNNFALSVMTVTGDQTSAINGTDRSLTELQTQSTYSGAVNGDGLGGLGWAFGNDDAHPWKMPSGTGFPILYWQK